MVRPRHPKKDGEALLQEAEAQGWRVEKGKKYYKIYCPCPDLHKATVHLTPNVNYWKRRRAELARRTCWKEGV